MPERSHERGIVQRFQRWGGWIAFCASGCCRALGFVVQPLRGLARSRASARSRNGSGMHRNSDFFGDGLFDPPKCGQFGYGFARRRAWSRALKNADRRWTTKPTVAQRPWVCGHPPFHEPQRGSTIKHPPIAVPAFATAMPERSHERGIVQRFPRWGGCMAFCAPGCRRTLGFVVQPLRGLARSRSPARSRNGSGISRNSDFFGDGLFEPPKCGHFGYVGCGFARQSMVTRSKTAQVRGTFKVRRTFFLAFCTKISFFQWVTVRYFP